MVESKGSYDAFSAVDSLVAKPVFGSDGAASWQQFRADRGPSSNSSSAAPALPLKKTDRVGLGSLEKERENESAVRRAAGDAPVGAGYTHFTQKGDSLAEVEARKRKKQLEQRIRPDKARYYFPSETFDGWKKDYVFTRRERGVGYYWDGMDSLKEAVNKTEGDIDAADGDTEEGDLQKPKKKKRKKSQPVHPVLEDDAYNPMEQVAQAILRRKQALEMGAVSGLAETSSVSKTPAWEKAVDPNSGRTYFFQRSTGKRTWQKPAGFQEATTESTNSAAVTTDNNSNGNEALPDGWKSANDATTGKVYYYNSSSGKTSWEKPIL
mmetsp:Transcript_2556/g.4642  ORF Transcript_2556/g.4642 Transcript_2556/m.4642 type:complete len:323 (-) Transcript_2556:703-1671(-)